MPIDIFYDPCIIVDCLERADQRIRIVSFFIRHRQFLLVRIDGGTPKVRVGLASHASRVRYPERNLPSERPTLELNIWSAFSRSSFLFSFCSWPGSLSTSIRLGNVSFHRAAGVTSFIALSWPFPC